MKKVCVISAMAMTLLLFNVSTASAAEPSDVVKLVNQSAYHLSITQKVSVDGEFLDGGWEQAPMETYDEQYYSENTRLLFIKIDVRSGESGPIVEEIFSKTIPQHDNQIHFEIIVQPDKTVNYATR